MNIASGETGPNLPKISVLMPVYNTDSQFLRETIGSVLNQTFRDFEFLIFNDGSSDGSVEETILTFNDGRIKYFANGNNLGIASSRNALIDLAQGEYLAIVDHDDVSLPERFEREVAYLDAHGDVGVVSSWIKILGKNKIVRDRIDDEDIKEDLLVKFCVFHPAAMIRKSILMDNNIRYEGDFFPSEDYALWCRLMSKTKFHVIPEVLFEYREHRRRTSLKFRNKLRHMGYVIREFARRENPDIWAAVQAKMTRYTYVKLFRYIPFLKIVNRGNRTGAYLFNLIPLLYWNKKDRV
ncbi:MAG: glycosyltransferase [Puniceicoccales bacterium]|jgi:glycosyltransferase involved in cell wall biosynthesis|nr:glycosyltransferase [Puniceicoccales bacterium]